MFEENSKYFIFFYNKCNLHSLLCIVFEFPTRIVRYEKVFQILIHLSQVTKNLSILDEQLDLTLLIEYVAMSLLRNFCFVFSSHLYEVFESWKEVKSLGHIEPYLINTMTVVSLQYNFCSNILGVCIFTLAPYGKHFTGTQYHQL